jgi:hypothetical protein
MTIFAMVNTEPLTVFGYRVHPKLEFLASRRQLGSVVAEELLTLQPHANCFFSLGDVYCYLLRYSHITLLQDLKTAHHT